MKLLCNKYSFTAINCLLVFTSCVLFSSYLFSQSVAQNKEVEIVREIVVEESGIHAISKSSSDTIVIDLNNNVVVYNYPEGYVSFWYKIYAKKDCEITFEIFPAEANNRYNYFLYKANGDLNVSDVKSKNVYPIRANLFADEMEKSGTGLSITSNVNYEDTGSVSKARRFYHSAYHGAVTAIAGDVLLLNIYHLKGNDCGQQFTLKSNNQSQKFQSLYQACFENHRANVKTERIVNLRFPPKVIVKPLPAGQAAKASYVIWDSLKHKTIDAEMCWTKKHKTSYTTVKGTGEIILEKNTVYTIIFSAVGYKSKPVTFLTTDSLISFSRYVFLTPVKEGENFSMDKIYFYPNTYAMRPEAGHELNKLLKYLKANTEIRIEIQGFTNGNNRIKASPDDMSEGSFTGSSKKLSKMRAEKIKNYLVENGIAEDRLISNGFGGSQMIYENPRNQEEANKNIRVGIQILPQKEGAYSSSVQVKR
ncbi:MAG: OmpA family protein [Bacteroidetes bacterium]|nr:MAG: OmpA family protein [Bacteroidota bacterium]